MTGALFVLKYSLFYRYGSLFLHVLCDAECHCSLGGAQLTVMHSSTHWKQKGILNISKTICKIFTAAQTTESIYVPIIIN